MRARLQIMSNYFFGTLVRSVSDVDNNFIIIFFTDTGDVACVYKTLAEPATFYYKFPSTVFGAPVVPGDEMKRARSFGSRRNVRRTTAGTRIWLPTS